MKKDNLIFSVLRQLKEGLFTNNPVLVQLIGMCPALAITTSLENGLGMGLATTAVMICSNITISLLRKLIPSKIRIACYVIIISGFVSVLDILLQAYLPALSEALGLFIPLIVVNCVIFSRAESYAAKNGVIRSGIDGLAMGLGFALALCLISALRELVGAGTINGIPLLGESYQPVLFFILPAGGFLSVAMMIALFRTVMRKTSAGKGAKS